jgi:hypothetical protein
MPKYLIQGSYSVDGIKGVFKEVILTPEEIDQAAKKTLSFRPAAH